MKEIMGLKRALSGRLLYKLSVACLVLSPMYRKCCREQSHLYIDADNKPLPRNKRFKNLPRNETPSTE